MAINTNPGTPLRHVATYNATGNFVVPQSKDVVFVSIHSAIGGSGGGQGARYSGTGLPTGRSTGAGGQGKVSGAFVSVTPGGTYAVTIGAGGVAGAGSGIGNTAGTAGGTGGTTSFDTAIVSVGSGGGQGGDRYTANFNAGTTAADASGITSLTSLSPTGALIRTSGLTSQTTGASTNPGVAMTNRYGNGVNGSAGPAGIVHIYL